MRAPLLIGAHMSVAGGVARAIARAVQYSFNCLQLFTHSPRVWAAPDISADACAAFRAARRAARLACVVVHAPYLSNCASASAALRTRSLAAIADDLRIADALGADYFVMHPGSAGAGARADALERVADALARMHAARPWRCTFLLENTAGGGALLGATFDELHRIIERVHARVSAARLGICLDTAHAHAAGMNLCSAAGVAALIADLGRTAGIRALHVIHCNDTAVARGARRDVHAHIGKGRIGATGFRLLLAHPLLRRLPWILETPKETARSDARNAALLRAWHAAVA
jgi:deoxyribonuclease-4